MYKVLKNESDFDDWIRVLPDEVSVVSTQTAVKNSLKEVLQRFDTYKSGRIGSSEGDKPEVLADDCDDYPQRGNRPACGSHNKN